MYKALTQFFQLRLLYIKAIPAGLETQWWSKISFLNECAINILKGFSPLLNLINTSESELLIYTVDGVVRQKKLLTFDIHFEKFPPPRKRGNIFFYLCVQVSFYQRIKPCTYTMDWNCRQKQHKLLARYHFHSRGNVSLYP